MKSDNVKGFKDYTGEEAEKRALIRKVFVDVFERYGFEPAETPIVEFLDFVKGENTGDDIISDIFRLKDKGKRDLALRYEFTFQLRRLMKNKKLPYKRYQVGEVFRDEPVSSNRFRQFVQCDLDIVGATVKDEAELFALMKDAFDELEIKFIIYFNNRKLLNEILDDLKIKKKEQVLREIDKLDKLSEKEVRKNLEKVGAGKFLDVIKKPESFFKKYKSYSEIQELKKYLRYYGVVAKFSPSLARGLSYYNGTVFEARTRRMKESIAGGGAFMFNNIQCAGFSFGLDRLANLAEVKGEKKIFLVISIGQDAEAIKLVKKLRKSGKNAVLFYGKLSKALDYANSKKINSVIFVGEEEVKKKKYKLKDMVIGKEKFISFEQIK